MCVCVCVHTCVAAPPPFLCPSGKWECPGGSQVCINVSLVCDGKIDCPAGHDESPVCSECLILLFNPSNPSPRHGCQFAHVVQKCCAKCEVCMTLLSGWLLKLFSFQTNILVKKREKSMKFPNGSIFRTSCVHASSAFRGRRQKLLNESVCGQHPFSSA